MSSLLVGRGGAAFATASAMLSKVGVLDVCIAWVAIAVRVWAWSSDYRSDDRVGARMVMCMEMSEWRKGKRVVLVRSRSNWRRGA
jgi:hypothetical protein